jgi:WD40 repeat protein
MDYVQCLAHAKQQSWVASGGFDRMIKLWDLNRERQDPIITFSPPEESNTKASVYAMATDAAGSFIASGSPEKVIRLWDPRSGKRTAKLVGHTDNIRSIIISEDGRYVSGKLLFCFLPLIYVVGSNRICRRIHQTLVPSFGESVYSHIFSSHRVRMVTSILSSIPINLLFGGPRWTRLSR